ncbi:hypothetical protein Tco_0529392 [Tanacetum coccineum]
MAELLYNQFRGDKFLLLRVQVEPTLQEQVEAILGNKGLLFVTTVKGKDMSKQCTKPKRKRDDSWFKDKVLLVQAQANGQILHEEELAFLADPGIAEVTLMANLSHYGSDTLAEVHNPNNVDTNIINQVVQAMPSFEQSNAAVQKSNSSAQQDTLILCNISQFQVNKARDLRVLQFGIRAKVMATPTIPISTEGNLGDPIDIRMDTIHPELVAVVVFPAATVVRTLAQHGEAIRGIQEQLVGVPIQEELMALRFSIDIAEAEIASLRARNKTTEAIEKITRNRERQARKKMERQLSLIQEGLESLRRSRRP